MKSLSLGSMGSAVRGLLITGGTNATPIVATVTAGHGLKNDDRIGIAGVTTLTSMNGDWSLGSVGATVATLLGSVGNGAFGGTAVAAVLCDRTPFLPNNDALVVIGNGTGAAGLVGTVVIEGADTINTVISPSQFEYTNTSGVSVAGFHDMGLSGQAAMPAIGVAGASLVRQVKLARYMTFRVSAFTSGSASAALIA